MATEKVKKAVIEKVKDMLNAELKKVSYKIHDNKNAIKRLAEEQAVLKRERAKLISMINSIK